MDATAPLDRFRRVLAERADWQRRLGAIERPDAFVDAAVAIAEGAGITLPAEAVEATLRVAPIALADLVPAASVEARWPPPGWLPSRSVPTATGEPAFDWVWFGPEPIVESFFQDAVRSRGLRPFALMTRVRTDFAALVDGAAEEGAESLTPTGLVFHMSRCGSTLAARMLAANPDHVVMSEAEPVDAVVRWAATSGAPFAEQVAALRAVVAALGRDRSGTSTRYFLKLDAWHAFALPLFRAAFPDTPWLFLHRDPVEVMVSLRASPGIQSAPGQLPAALIGFDPADIVSLDDYTARLFAALFDRVLAMLGEDAGGGGLVIGYLDLVPAMLRAVPAHFGFMPTSAEAEAMARAARHDAKDPSRIFTSDSEEKLARATSAMSSAVEERLSDRYAALHQLSWRRSSDRDRPHLD